MAASRIIIITALMLAASPALSETYPVCRIVVANDRPSTQEIYRHEVAHCNGWTHEDQGHPDGGPRPGYRAPQPPQRYLHRYPGKLVVISVPTDRAVEICGSYGCAWGGLLPND